MRFLIISISNLKVTFFLLTFWKRIVLSFDPVASSATSPPTTTANLKSITDLQMWQLVLKQRRRCSSQREYLSSFSADNTRKNQDVLTTITFVVQVLVLLLDLKCRFEGQVKCLLFFGSHSTTEVTSHNYQTEGLLPRPHNEF